MRRSRYLHLLASGLAVAVLTGGPSSAYAADEPLCPPDKPAMFSLSAPTEGAFGRQIRWTMQTTEAYRSYYGLGEHVTVQAADPTRSISHPWEGDVLANFPPDQPLLVMEAGDGPVAINASWIERIDRSYERGDYYYCSRAASALTNPIPGTVPRIDLGRGSDSIDLSLSNAPSVSDPTTDRACVTYGVQRVSFELLGSQKATYTLGDPCGQWTASKSGRVSTPYLRLHGDGTGSLAVEPRGRRRGVRAFRYRVRLGGHVVRRGRFWLRIRYEPGYAITEDDTDSFVNQCINGPRRIWSRNGKLYCHEPGWFTRKLFFKRRPKR